MKFNNFVKNLATLGPLGYLLGSGTIGTLVSLLSLALIKQIKLEINFYYQTVIILVFIFLAFNIIKSSVKQFNLIDPPEIIIDEVIGTIITFYGISVFNIKTAIIGFLLFRFFDITKTFGISYIEKYIIGSWAILIDDIAAGIISNILLRCIL